MAISDNTSLDVIAYLESRENKNDTIRQALRDKMSKEA